MTAKTFGSGERKGWIKVCLDGRLFLTVRKHFRCFKRERNRERKYFSFFLNSFSSRHVFPRKRRRVEAYQGLSSQVTISLWNTWSYSHSRCTRKIVWREGKTENRQLFPPSSHFLEKRLQEQTGRNIFSVLYYGFTADMPCQSKAVAATDSLR